MALAARRRHQHPDRGRFGASAPRPLQNRLRGFVAVTLVV